MEYRRDRIGKVCRDQGWIGSPCWPVDPPCRTGVDELTESESSCSGQRRSTSVLGGLRSYRQCLLTCPLAPFTVPICDGSFTSTPAVCCEKTGHSSMPLLSRNAGPAPSGIVLGLNGSRGPAVSETKKFAAILLADMVG